MVLAHGSFANNAVVFPAQMSKMNRQRDAREARCGRRSAASTNGNFVVDMDTKGRDLAILRFEHLAVGGDDEVVLHASADVCVAALGGDKKIGRTLGPQAKMEIECQGGASNAGPRLADVAGSARRSERS
jgi:hypothetical protein